MASDISHVVAQTQAYYDGPADEIYRRLWGDNVHMGSWQEGDTLQDAMARSNERMADLGGIKRGADVLDVGSGYGAAAIYLASERECNVVGLNLSERENTFARGRVAEQGLADRVAIRQGDFHDLPFDDMSFDVVWSQEALLHAVDKRKVLDECFRVLRVGGKLVLSDLLMHADVEDDERQVLYARVGTPEMWDFANYSDAIRNAGFDIEVEQNWTQNVAPTYAAVRSALAERRNELLDAVPNEHIERTMIALGQWVRAGEQDRISHGFFAAVRPA